MEHTDELMGSQQAPQTGSQQTPSEEEEGSSQQCSEPQNGEVATPWSALQRAAHAVVTQEDFEALILIITAGSCVSLAAYDPLQLDLEGRNFFLFWISELVYAHAAWASTSPASHL